MLEISKWLKGHHQTYAIYTHFSEPERTTWEKNELGVRMEGAFKFKKNKQFTYILAISLKRNWHRSWHKVYSPETSNRSKFKSLFKCG